MLYNNNYDNVYYYNDSGKNVVTQLLVKTKAYTVKRESGGKDGEGGEVSPEQDEAVSLTLLRCSCCCWNCCLCFSQELLVLLLHHQLLQGQGLGMGLGRAPLGQGGRLGPPQGPVLPLQLGHGRRRQHGQAAHAWVTDRKDCERWRDQRSQGRLPRPGWFQIV